MRVQLWALQALAVFAVVAGGVVVVAVAVVAAVRVGSSRGQESSVEVDVADVGM